jgi:O-antigen/teichoic acid export membrane protein
MKLKEGVSVTLIANIIFAMSQWIIIAGLNYTGKTDVVGQYAFVIAIAGLFLTVGQLGLRPYLLSSIVREREAQYVFQVRFITSVTAFLGLVIFSCFFLSPTYFMLILVLGAGKIIENLSDICHGYYQKNFQIQQIVYSRIFRSIVSPILFLILFYYTEDIVFASTGIFVSLLSTFYFFDKNVLVQQSIPLLSVIPFKQFKRIVSKAFPMGIAAVLVILVVSIPLFILKESESDVVVGMYASIFYFVTAGSLVLQSAMQVISPILTHNIKKNSVLVIKSIVIKSYFMAGLFGLIGIFLASIFGSYVLALLYGSSFKNLGDLLVIASLINFTLAFQAVGGVALTSFGVFKYQMYCMLFIIPIGYFSSLFLVSIYGINGALYAGAISSFIIASLFLFKLLNKLNEIEKN